MGAWPHVANTNKPLLSPQAHRGANMGLKLSCLKGKAGGSPPPALRWVEGRGGEWGRNEAGEGVSVDPETLVLLPWRGGALPNLRQQLYTVGAYKCLL